MEQYIYMVEVWAIVIKYLMTNYTYGSMIYAIC